MIVKLEGRAEKINRSETFRYLSVKEPDENLIAIIGECERLILDAHALSAVYDIFNITVDGDKLDLGFIKTQSAALSRHLLGCKKIVLFACTAGAGVDRLIQKYARISPARAAVMQALGAALVEGWCDELCDIFKREFGELKTRFSCGYGDFDLSVQRDIFATLQVTKHLGISLSQNLFMTPTKSVTAVVGIKN